MHDRVLRTFRECIRQRRFVLTLHAEEEMDEDGLTVFDIESAVLTGRIIQRQRDRQTFEFKHVVAGLAVDGSPMGVVGVVGKLSATGKLVIVTAYRE